MGLINIIPTEDTFFKAVEIPKNVELSPELVKINYQHLSPFTTGDILFFKTKNLLYLWFIKYPLPENKKVNIPEGYFIYKQFRNKKNAVIIVKKDNSVIISVIKDGEMLSQFSLSSNLAVNLKDRIELLKKEYSLKNPEIIEINKNQLKLRTDFRDILKFSRIKVNKESLIGFLLESVKVPLIIVLTAISFYDIFLLNYLEKEKEKKQKTLQQLKRENAEIKNLMFKLEEESKFWNSFIKEELKFENIYNVLTAIGKVLKEKNGKFESLNYSENLIDLWIKTKSKSTTLIDKLIKTGYFQEVKIISSAKDLREPEYEVTNLQLILKEKYKGKKQ
jgi:hypothetical protein